MGRRSRRARRKRELARSRFLFRSLVLTKKLQCKSYDGSRRDWALVSRTPSSEKLRRFPAGLPFHTVARADVSSRPRNLRRSPSSSDPSMRSLEVCGYTVHLGFICQFPDRVSSRCRPRLCEKLDFPCRETAVRFLRPGASRRVQFARARQRASLERQSAYRQVSA